MGFEPNRVTVICLPMPPSVNGLFSGQKRRFRSPEYKAWAMEAGLQLNRQKPVSVAGRVSLLIEVAEPKTKRAQDLDNKTKALLDLLVSHGVIEGDDQRYVRRITLEWAPIEGVRVTIEAMP